MARETQRSGARPIGGETQKPSRWQLTTRSRFALVLGLAGLAVAGVQVAMLSDPPTVIQIVVVAFWGLVGFGYLLSAVATRLRERRRPAPAPAAAAPVEEIVPVPVRPARPRPRRESSSEAVSAATKAPERAPRTEAVRPAAATAREGHVAQDQEAAQPAERAARTEAVRPAAHDGHVAHDREAAKPAERAARTQAVRPAAGRPTPARPTPARPTPARPAAARPEPVRPDPVRPDPALTETMRPPSPPRPAAPAPVATSRVAIRARRPERPVPERPMPEAAPEPTTVAFRNRTSAPSTGSRPAVTPTGGGSSLSFGAGPAPRSARPDPLDPSTPIPVPPVDLTPSPRAPSPISGPLPTAGARTFGDTPRSTGRRHAAEDADAPAPHRPRHRADVEDPVAARRGTPGPNAGRHASVGHAGR